MKTKILALTLLIGLTIDAMAQSAPIAASAPPQAAPLATAPGNSGQAMSLLNGSQTNGVIPVVSTNHMNFANTNGANGFNASNGPANRRGTNVMTNTNKFNPYANYTNPNAIYINPNSTNVSPGSQYTNPYATN
jgi:hypothetical protein